MGLKKCIKLYPHYLAQNFKSLMEYRIDFFIGLVGFFFLQTCGVEFIKLVFNSIPNLKGWEFYEVLFIYGFAQIPRGLDHVFTDNLWLYAGWKIEKGEMDRLLTRPVNPLFQLIAERFQPDGLGEFLIGTVLSVWAGIHLGLRLNAVEWAVALTAVFCGAAIITGIKLFYMTFAFWVKRSQSYVYTAYNFNEFCYYPITIYNRALQFFLTFVVPFAVTSYFPAAYLLGKGNLFQGLCLPVMIAVVFTGGAYLFWKKGLAHYESAGS